MKNIFKLIATSIIELLFLFTIFGYAIFILIILKEKGNKMEKSSTDKVFDIIDNMKLPPKIIKDRSGYLHLLFDRENRQVSYFHTMEDILNYLKK